MARTLQKTIWQFLKKLHMAFCTAEQLCSGYLPKLIATQEPAPEVLSCLMLRNPMDCSTPGSPIFAIFSWSLLKLMSIESDVYCSFIHNCLHLKQPRCPLVGEWINTLLHPDDGMLCAQSGLTICSPMDCSPKDPCVHGISQARTLESVAISYSRGSC